MVVAGSEAESLYGLLRGALSQSPMSIAQPPPKRCCQAPSTTASKPPPQEPQKVASESPTPTPEGGILAHEASSLAISQAFEVAILTNMAPLCLNVRTSKGFISAGLRGVVRDLPPPMQPFALKCTGCIWVEAGLSLLFMDFLNSDSLMHHKKKIHT